MNSFARACKCVSMMFADNEVRSSDIADHRSQNEDWNGFDVLEVPEEMNKEISIHQRVKCVEKKSEIDSKAKAFI